MAKYKWDNLILFAEQLSTASNLQLPLDKSIAAISQDAFDYKWKALLQSISKHVSNGSTLSQAMDEYPGYFPAMMRQFVRIGERGKALPLFLRSLSSYLQTAQYVNTRLKNCIIYPFIIWHILLIQMGLMFWKILPMFEELYGSLGSATESMPRVLVDFLYYGPAFFVGIISLVMYFVWVLIGIMSTDVEGNSKIGVWVDKIIAYTPIFGAMTRHAKSALACEVIGLMMKNGMTGTQSVQVAVETVDSPLLKHAFEELHQKIQPEYSLHENTKTLIPYSTLWMLNQSTNSEEVGESLCQLAELHRRHINVMSSIAREILEPLLFIVVAILSGLAVVTLYYPIFDIVNKIQ